MRVHHEEHEGHEAGKTVLFSSLFVVNFEIAAWPLYALRSHKRLVLAEKRGFARKNDTFFCGFSCLCGLFFCNPLPRSDMRRTEPSKKIIPKNLPFLGTIFLKGFDQHLLLKRNDLQRKKAKKQAKCKKSATYFPSRRAF